MVTRLLRWFYGWVRVEAEGGYPERLLNELVAAGVPLWHLRRQEERVGFSCPAGEYRRCRPLARRACVRMRVRQKCGLPFWRHRYRHRKGLLLGICLYVTILALLAPRIWVIEVVGNEITPTESILTVVKQRGIRLGTLMSGADIKGIQMSGPDALDTVAFITVNPRGCVARVEVTERDPTPEVIDLSTPSNLVAIRDGRILRTEVRSGRLLVKSGEAVSAGTVLVSGAADASANQAACRAYGVILAETQRRITVTVPLHDTRWIPSGNRLCRPTLSLLCWDFPLYSKTALQGNYRQNTGRHFLTINGGELPFGITCRWIQPMVAEPFLRTKAEAEEEANRLLEQQETALFSMDGFEKKTHTGRVRDGAYVLTATYVCRENIALEVPIP